MKIFDFYMIEHMSTNLMQWYQATAKLPANKLLPHSSITDLFCIEIIVLYKDWFGPQ